MIGPGWSDEPYPGLRSFDRDETHIFFGRESTIDNMVDRLAAHHFLAVTGNSGSGKSSLVRTGLLDALERGLLSEAGAHWCVADFRPGQRPLSAMAGALLDATNIPRTDQEVLLTEAMLARGPYGLLDWWRGAGLPAQANLLVLADQFEELFRFRQGRTGDDIDAFVALLLESANEKTQRIYVVITMRSDFLGECAQFAGLAEMINDGQFLTPRLSREQRREAIEGPATVYGGSVEARLVNRLLNDTETSADQLPLMQHVLMRLWRIAKARAGNDVPVLTLADYESLGGIGAAPAFQFTGETDADRQAASGALSAHADEVLRELSDEQRDLAMRLFRALTESEGAGGRDVRRPITLQEAADVVGVPMSTLIPVIEAFRAPGRNFLMPSPDVALRTDVVIDISHESLIRQWSKLREWARDEYRSAETYWHLETTARLWKRGEAALWTMPDLESARAWREREKPNAAWAARYGGGFDVALEFLDRSQEAEAKEAERKRQEAEDAIDRKILRVREAAAQRLAKLTLAAAAVLFIVAVIATAFGFMAISAEQQAARNYAAAKGAADELISSFGRELRLQKGISSETLDIAFGAIDTLLRRIEEAVSHQESFPTRELQAAFAWVATRLFGAPSPARDEAAIELSRATFLYEFAETYHQSANDLNKARQSAQRSLEIQTRLQKEGDASVSLAFGIALTHLELGDIERKAIEQVHPILRVDTARADFAPARAHYEAALGLLEPLASHFPGRENWASDESKLLTRLGDLDMKAGNREAAKQHFAPAQALAFQAFRAAPNDLDALNELAWSYRKLGQVEQDNMVAQRTFTDEVCLRRHLVELKPDVVLYAQDLGYALIWLGQTHTQSQPPDFPAAQDAFDEAFYVMLNLLEKEKSKKAFFDEFGLALRRISDTYGLAGNGELAGVFKSASEDVARNASDLFADLPANDPARGQAVERRKLLQQRDTMDMIEKYKETVSIEEHEFEVSRLPALRREAEGCWQRLQQNAAELNVGGEPGK